MIPVVVDFFLSGPKENPSKMLQISENTMFRILFTVPGSV